MLPRCPCISRCGRCPCKPYRPSVYFSLYFRLSCMMLLIVGYKCSRPALSTASAQSYTFFITIKKVCAHDNKGFTSRQKRFVLTMKKLAVGLCSLTIKIFSLWKLLFKTSKLVDRWLIIYAPRPRLCHLRAARLRMSEIFRYVMFITHFICASSQT